METKKWDAYQAPEFERYELPAGLSEGMADAANQIVLEWEDDTDRIAIDLVIKLFRLFMENR